MNHYDLQIKYNNPRTGWEDVERFVVGKSLAWQSGWPSFTVQQRLHNWLVAYFYNIKKGATPSK
jgi:hypothetical protein